MQVFSWAPASSAVLAVMRTLLRRLPASSARLRLRRCEASAAATEQARAAPELPELRLFNSLSREKEVFTPRPGLGNKVSLYVCGVTVYDYRRARAAHVSGPPAARFCPALTSAPQPYRPRSRLCRL